LRIKWILRYVTLCGCVPYQCDKTYYRNTPQRTT
jgi:hypothetical protein